MGKRSRLHREAVQNGTEQPFRQPGQHIKPKPKRNTVFYIGRRDYLLEAGMIVMSSLFSNQSAAEQSKQGASTDPILAIIPTEVKHAD
jgi:hypothetical protein